MDVMLCGTTCRRRRDACASGPHHVSRPARRCPRRHGGDPSEPVAVGRYYDPQTGQFFSLDPDLGQTQQQYQYAGDNPTNESDPGGADPEYQWNGSKTEYYGTARAGVLGAVQDIWNVTLNGRWVVFKFTLRNFLPSADGAKFPLQPEVQWRCENTEGVKSCAGTSKDYWLDPNWLPLGKQVTFSDKLELPANTEERWHLEYQWNWESEWGWNPTGKDKYFWGPTRFSPVIHDYKFVPGTGSESWDDDL